MKIHDKSINIRNNCDSLQQSVSQADKDYYIGWKSTTSSSISQKPRKKEWWRRSCEEQLGDSLSSESLVNSGASYLCLPWGNQTRCLCHLMSLLLMRRSSCSTLFPCWMTQLLTLSLSERMDNLWRKQILGQVQTQSCYFGLDQQLAR